MSSEVFQIVQKLNPKSVETQLILQCAPLIAGLKASNLLKINSDNEKDVEKLFSGTCISCIRLVKSGGKSVLLLYRADMLMDHIAKKDSRQLLMSMGYEDIDYLTLILHVRSKYEAYTDGDSDFPHELGLLLGYPCEDVKGYMEDKGRHALYTGYWQVYKDPAAKVRIFEAYEKAREKMARLASDGMGLKQIMKNIDC